ncbi:MAG: FtsW/RodA/SpoVE family cell cycle protein [Lachnospiraceae bacterium]|nr:FtsW/RodA/SpoVE family cell cycle protein [Lachnospiraceae bacterium]
MQEYFVELSKYFITLAIAFYALESLLIFRLKQETQRSACYIRQICLLFLSQLLCFLTLYFRSKDREYLLFYMFIQVFMIAAVVLSPLIHEHINRGLLHNMCMLLGLGFVILSRLSLHRAMRQFFIVVVVFIIGMILSMIIAKLKFWYKLTWLYALLGISMLSTVLLLGNLTRGSKLSISLAGFTFQPSEVVKLIFILFLAAALYEDTSFKRIAVTAILAGMHVAVLAVSRDLGSALIFFVGFVFVVFVASGSYLYLGLGILGGCVSAVSAYYLFAHVRVRVLAWQDPFTYIDNQSYQITQSFFAITNGSWFGTGLYRGRPEAIPYVDTDFVFSAVCEELGVISGICLLLICLSCFVMMMRIGMESKDIFVRLAATGFGIIYIFQVFLTIGGGIKFIPLTGVTLPLISYGGSSVMATLLMFSLVQGLCIKEGEERNVYGRNTKKKRSQQDNVQKRTGKKS